MGTILGDLANSAESRREAKKKWVESIERLAKRLIKMGRAEDRHEYEDAHSDWVRVGDRSYGITSAVWELETDKGRMVLSKPVKTFAMELGECSTEEDERGCFVHDTRRLVSLITLDPDDAEPNDFRGSFTVSGAPKRAYFREAIAAVQAGNLEPDEVGCLDFEKARESDLEQFQEDAKRIIQALSAKFLEDAQSYQTSIEHLDLMVNNIVE